ncbi:MBL fold metallo-hydrolase [Salinispira pacifica]
MRLLYHFSPGSLSNVYVVAPPEGGDALIIDPGVMDVPLLEMIEAHDLYIRSILVTHERAAHLGGIRTLLRIYDAKIYAANPQVLDYEATPVANSSGFRTSGLDVVPIALSGYWSDALIYRIGGMLFVGEVMSAGRVGETVNPYARALLIADLRERILPLPAATVVLPTEGPPSTLAVEARTNRELMHPDGDLPEKP